MAQEYEEAMSAKDLSPEDWQLVANAVSNEGDISGAQRFRILDALEGFRLSSLEAHST